MKKFVLCIVCTVVLLITSCQRYKSYCASLPQTIDNYLSSEETTAKVNSIRSLFEKKQQKTVKEVVETQPVSEILTITEEPVSYNETELAVENKQQESEPVALPSTESKEPKTLDLIIPSSITTIPADAFSGHSEITSITIPDSVTSIGASAFEGCSGLTSVIIPASVTSIGDKAFKDCTGLTQIEIPDSVTSMGYDVFYGCTGLTDIIINVLVH